MIVGLNIKKALLANKSKADRERLKTPGESEENAMENAKKCLVVYQESIKGIVYRSAERFFDTLEDAKSYAMKVTSEYDKRKGDCGCYVYELQEEFHS